MAFFAVVQTIFNHRVFFSSSRSAMRARVALNVLIYRKILRLHGSALREAKIGYVTNLVTNDCARVEQGTMWTHFSYYNVIHAFICVGLLFLDVELAAFAGLGVLAILFPVQILFGKKIAAARRSVILYTDERIRYVNELLQGIRVVKYFAWEPGFWKKIGDVRNHEYDWLKYGSYVKAMNDAIFFSSNSILIVLVFTFYIILYGKLTATTAFTSLALFNLISRALANLPRGSSLVVEGYAGTKRVSAFLLLPETNHIWNPEPLPYSASSSSFSASYEPPALTLKKIPELKRHDSSSPPSPIAISMDNASFSWLKTQSIPTLKNLTFQLPTGQMLAVIGKVGSGKSSFISAILNEMWCIEGSCAINTKYQETNHNIAYVPQQAWILNSTFRENIIFGLPFDENKYNEVLKVCALEDDLLLLPAGDLTEIGEKGINLSGGQKQRVSLARACYSNPEIILLDDPLSAVDQNVGKYIFENCICGLLKNKTRILVLHQLQYLKSTEIYKILRLHLGQLVEFEIYENSTVKKLVEENNEGKNPEEEENEEGKKKKAQESSSPNGKKREIKNGEGKKGVLVGKEDRETGVVTSNVYKKYIAAAGWITWPFVLIIFCISQGFSVFGSYWIAYWVDDTFEKNPNNLSNSQFYIYGLILVAFLQLTFSFVRALLVILATLKAASLLHNNMFKKLLTAPTSYFDVTPLGRILNRFSQDMDQLDQMLPFNLMNFLSFIFVVIGGLLAIVAVTYWFALSFVPVLILFIYFQTYAQRTSRQLKRLASVTRSPIYSHLGSTLLGLDSVRAYYSQSRFHKGFIQHINHNCSATFLFMAVGRWIGLRLDLISSALVGVTTALVVLLKDNIEPGLAGVAITQSLQLSGLFQFAVRQAAEVENSMTSVERIVASDTLPVEGNPEVEAKSDVRFEDSQWKDDKEWSHWPRAGEVEFKDACMRYRVGLEPVLKGVNFKVKAGKRIGIAGRTGAGKSSILVCLFRMTELSSGKILIDNQDISQLPLHVLRSRISIIPQDPVLFQGSIRSNLDPLDLYSTKELWEVVDRIHLRENIETLSDKIDHKIEENGGNLSVGERQLLCLGRALLRNSKVIVMDEATANVDTHTDKKIQETIRKEFKNATVLTIAHRINTIIDSDYILVMKEGIVAEYDTPQNLISNPSSLFSQLLHHPNSK